MTVCKGKWGCQNIEGSEVLRQNEKGYIVASHHGKESEKGGPKSIRELRVFHGV